MKKIIKKKEIETSSELVQEHTKQVEGKKNVTKPSKRKEAKNIQKIFLEQDDFTLENEGKHFVTKKAKKFKVTFASDLSEKKVFTIQKDEHPLSMAFQGRNANMHQARKAKGKIKKNQVQYLDVEDGVDLIYQCRANGIKESVVIHQKQENYDFNFTLQIGDLTPIFNEKENTLELQKEGKSIYRIASPFMTDRNGKRSDDCSYEIEQNENELKLVLHCDAAWIESLERAFPILVDPTIEVVSSSLFQIETLVNGEKDETVESLTIGKVQYYPNWFYYGLRVLINAPLIQQEYRGITQIQMRFKTKELGSQDNLDSDLYVARCGEQELALVTKREMENEWIFDITPYVQQATSTVELILYHIDDGNLEISETRTVIKPPVGAVLYDSRVYFYGLEEEEGPCLLLEKEENGKVETKENQYAIGRAGTTYIQVNTGHMRHEHPDHISIQQGKNMLSLSHHYDDQSRNKNEVGLGKGWTSNFHQYIKKSQTYHETLGDKEITYIDGEGKSHFFYEQWYYLQNDQRVYVKKDVVYMDADMKLKCLDQNQKEHEVTYECKNDEGLQFISASSIYNYHLTERIVAKGDLFLSIANTKLKLEKDQDRVIMLPHFYSGDEAATTRQYKAYNKVYQMDGGFQDASGNTLKVMYIGVSIRFDQGNLYVVGYRSAMKGASSWLYLNPIHIYVQLQQNNIFDYEDDILDVYVNEDLRTVLERLEGMDQQFSEWENSREILERQRQLTESRKENYQIRWNQTYSTTGEEGKQEPTKEEIDAYCNEIEGYDISLQSYRNQLDMLLMNYQSYVLEKKRLLALRQTLIDMQLKKTNDFLIDQEGNTLGFDGYGRLILIQDKYENKMEIEYGYEKENEGKMLSIFSDTQTIRMHYDKATGLLSSIVDPQGKKTKYDYHSDQQLISITYSDGQKTTFDYTNGFQATSPFMETNHLVMHADAIRIKQYCYDGTITQNIDLDVEKTPLLCLDEQYIFNFSLHQTIIRNQMRYPSDALEAQEEDLVYLFDTKGNVIKIKDGKNTSVFHYQEKKCVYEATYKNHASIFGSFTPNASSSSHHFDVSRNSLPVSNLLGIKIDGEGIEDQTYRVSVSISHIEGEESITETQEYGVFSSSCVLPIPIDHRYPLSLDIEILSDANDFVMENVGEMVLVQLENGTIYTYDENHNLIKEKDGYSTKKYLDYDADQLCHQTIESNIYGEEITTKYGYNDFKQLTYSEDSKGNVEEYYYDEKGNCIEKRVYNKKDASLMKVEKVSYDEQGRPTSTIGAIKKPDGSDAKEEITYVPGTNTESKIKGVNGESVCYQYDYHTGDLLSISSSSMGINNSTTFTYHYGLLTSMSHHGMKVEYAYDGKGRKTKILLDGKEMLLGVYVDDYDSSTDNAYCYNEPITHGRYLATISNTGLRTNIYENDKGQVKYMNEQDEDDVWITSYQYENDKVSMVGSAILRPRYNETYQESISNTYNALDQIVKQEKKVNDISQLIVENHYDEDQRFVISSDMILSEDNNRIHTMNIYNADHQLTEIQVQKGIVGREDEASFSPIAEATFDYDALGRVKHENIHANQIDICHTYSYLQQDENSLDLIAEDITKIKIQNGNQTTYLTETLAYSYDVNGNIVTMESDENKTRYAYDALNRLVREDNPYLKKTYVYQYDQAGNLLLKKTYTYNIVQPELQLKPTIMEYIYDCDHKDRLISFGGKAIMYDQMGRPTTYKGSPFHWNSKNQLIGIGDQIAYLYDGNGIRRKKIINGIAITYITNGNQILSMKEGNKKIVFRYVLNKLVGFHYNNGSQCKEYLYQRNIQGDIIGIFDDDGNQVGGYAYDAYGNQVITIDEGGIATLNPFRYRGYYWDEESHLYYLNSRYYDPETGRFISPDILSILDETKGQINGLNLYMYCADNPIMFIDPNGNDFWDIFRVIGKVILYGVSIAVSFICPLAGLVVAGVGLAMLIVSDIYQIASGNVHFDPEKGQIVNSSKISLAPTIQLYSLYLKYFSPYQEYFEGSASGIIGEWTVHNIAYDLLNVVGLFTKKIDKWIGQAEQVDIGHSIFEENRPLVLIASMLFGYPLGILKDLLDKIKGKL